MQSSASSDQPIPDDLDAALRSAPGARLAFDRLPPSHKREYLEWIASARKDATRLRRIEQTVVRLLGRH